MTGMICLFNNQCGRQMVVIVCDNICLGRRVVPLRWGAGPKRSFPLFASSDLSISEPFPAALTKQLC